MLIIMIKKGKIMTNKELYKIAYNYINHIDLKQFGTAGHVACAL